MPELIKAAYQMEKDFVTFSGVLPPEARKEFKELKRGLKLAENELTRLEARHKEGISERYFQCPAQSQEQSRGMRMKR